MTTIMPQSELLTRALKWMADARAEVPGRSFHSLVDEAGMRFNLSPAETEQLLRFGRHPDLDSGPASNIQDAKSGR